MCGIAGVVYTDPHREPEPGLLGRMAHALRFRGPDAEGLFHAPGVGLAHRRLAVLDLAGSQQPMADETGQVVVVFNGEIYNFQDLRRELANDGPSFRTTGDTEVLLRAYLRLGPDAVQRLAGMFALAIWDARWRSLLFARDRLGVKPLYWTRLPDGSLVFGSELSAVIAHPGVPRKLDHRQAVSYFSLGYVLGEDSLLTGIERLPPATTLLWRHDRPVVLQRYWDLAEVWSHAAAGPARQETPEEPFAELLREAVQKRLVSDVPLGAFLSGGLDSSTIVALMRQATPQVESFSIGFSEKSYNELPYARQTAGQIGTRHHDEVIRGDDPALLQEIADRLDEPFADTSIVPTYVLCRSARKRVTVALSGDGGDELLAGYVTHLANTLHAWVRRMPRLALKAAGSALRLVPDSRGKVSLTFKAKQFLRGAALSPLEAHASWRLLATLPQLQELIEPDAWPGDVDLFARFRQAHAEAKALGPLDRFLYVDYKTWLVDDILVKADRASMAHGLEVRSPFLDHRLLEFCCGLPARWKRRGREGKVLLRRMARGLVPQAVLDRSKQGFNAPVAHWLCAGWRELAEATFARSPGILRPAVLRRLLDEHHAGRRDHGYLLFTLLMYCLWQQRVQPSAA